MDKMGVESIGTPKTDKPVFHLYTTAFYSAVAAKPLVRAISEHFPLSPIFCLNGGIARVDDLREWMGAEADLVSFSRKTISNVAVGSPDIMVTVPPDVHMRADEKFHGSWVTPGLYNLEVNPELAKFEVSCPVSEAERKALKESLGIGNQFVVVAGSLHEFRMRPSIGTWFDIHERLVKENSGIDLVTIIAPRSMIEMEVIKDSFKDYRLRSKRYSKPIEGSGIIVLDSFGELPRVYSIADVAYVDMDHNLVEPMEQGVPVLYWRHNNMFPLTVAGLEKAGGGIPVNKTREILDAVSVLMHDSELRQQMGVKAKKFKEDHRGVVGEVMEHCRKVVGDYNKKGSIVRRV